MTARPSGFPVPSPEPELHDQDEAKESFNILLLPLKPSIVAPALTVDETAPLNASYGFPL